MQEFALVVALTVGLTQVAKMTGVSNRWYPLFALVIGVALAFLVEGAAKTSVVEGIIAALSSMGLWSGVKATVK
jgi:hypothetical protein